MVIKMLFNNKLRFLRDRAGKKQFEIAEFLGLSNTVYCNYENEKYLIPIKHLISLANYYKVSIDYIFSFTETKSYNNSKNKIDKKLSGQRLKEIRTNKEITGTKTFMTQRKFAEIINASIWIISDSEKGKSILSTQHLYNVCTQYKISSDYLLGLTDKPIFFQN